MSDHINKLRIKVVSNALKPLNEKIVFVGGATISLYSDRQAFDVRPTDDVDVILEILDYNERSKLDEKLRDIGFINDIESNVICRYKIQGIIVDIMPTDDSSIGFKNLWYTNGFENAVDCQIDDDTIVKILSAPYFIATKLEAHKGRGENDGRTSHDFEDIVYVLENRSNIWEEILAADSEIKNYLKEEFQTLLNNPNIEEWIGSHVERSPQPATNRIIAEMEKFVKSN